MRKALCFLIGVQQIVLDRGRPRRHLKRAMMVAANLPEDVDVAKAVSAFVRWLYRDAPEEGDDRIVALAATAVSSGNPP